MPGAPDAVPVVMTRQIPVPAAEINACLSQGPAALLGTSEAGMETPDGRHLVPLRVRFAGVHFDRTAAVGFGPVIEEDDGTKVLPLWWEAAEQPWLFPTFNGGLEARPLGEGAELRLEGRYRPPLGAAGRLVDRAVLNRAATASLKTLLERLSARLTGGPGQPAALHRHDRHGAGCTEGERRPTGPAPLPSDEARPRP
jgi:hypothetical protein